MTAFDIVVIGLLAICAGLGFWRGFVSEVLAIAAWVVAIVLARLFTVPLAEQMIFIEGELVRQAAAFLAILIGTLMAGGILRWILRELLKAAGLGAADRILGAGFGVVKGLVIALVVVLLGGLTGVSQAGWWRQAVLTPPLETAVLAARPLMPEAVANRVRFD
ncbi:MAG: CvpA family protein [Rhodocyclaceae bacterium]|nr:CvpA family protein [Rhodocyclaceae bacterium]